VVNVVAAWSRVQASGAPRRVDPGAEEPTQARPHSQVHTHRGDQGADHPTRDQAVFQSDHHGPEQADSRSRTGHRRCAGEPQSSTNAAGHVRSPAGLAWMPAPGPPGPATASDPHPSRQRTRGCSARTAPPRHTPRNAPCGRSRAPRGRPVGRGFPGWGTRSGRRCS